MSAPNRPVVMKEEVLGLLFSVLVCDAEAPEQLHVRYKAAGRLVKSHAIDQKQINN